MKNKFLLGLILSSFAASAQAQQAPCVPVTYGTSYAANGVLYTCKPQGWVPSQLPVPSAKAGDWRFNTASGAMEFYNGQTWLAVQTMGTGS